MNAETKAVNLHKALSALLERYRELLKDTDREPLFSQDIGVTLAEAALYDNRPLADWEVTTVTQDNRGTS
jgi:hypothetical protein